MTRQEHIEALVNQHCVAQLKDVQREIRRLQQAMNSMTLELHRNGTESRLLELKQMLEVVRKEVEQDIAERGFMP